MAINRATEYPGRFDNATSTRPQGAFKNRTTDTSKDGSYLEKDWLNDWDGFFSSLFFESGESPDGSVDEGGTSQLYDLMKSLRQVENRFKGNQNWNVEGGTGAPLPTVSAYTYSASDEVAAGRFCLVSLVNATYDGDVFDGDSGSYYIEYEGDFTSDFYGVKLANGTITQTGCTLALVSGKTRLTVDVGVVGAHKFPGLSELVGRWPNINDAESTSNYGPDYQDLTSSRATGVEYKNESGRVKYLLIRMSGSPTLNASLIVDDNFVANYSNSASAGGGTFSLPIKPDSTYKVTVDASTTIASWFEG